MPEATKRKPARYDMLVNVPCRVDIRYIDVWPDTNGYGSQVSIKGTVDGETQTIYLKGKTWANLKALAAAGVIDTYDKAIEEPTEKVNVPVLAGAGITLTRKQGPGERFPNLVVDNPNGAPVARSVETPQLGRPIPGLDDDDLPPPIDEAYRSADPEKPEPNAKLLALYALYDECFDHAVIVAKMYPNVSPDVSAMAATLFIQANQRGITV